MKITYTPHPKTEHLDEMDNSYFPTSPTLIALGKDNLNILPQHLYIMLLDKAFLKIEQLEKQNFELIIVLEDLSTVLGSLK